MGGIWERRVGGGRKGWKVGGKGAVMGERGGRCEKGGGREGVGNEGLSAGLKIHQH